MVKFKLAICLLMLASSISEPAFSQKVNQKPKAAYIPSTPQEEIDMMASMCGIAIIYKDWQSNSGKTTSRGYNIGSVLIDYKGDTSVSYALNSVHCFNNGTQHGEVRIMQEYSFATNNYYLDSCTIYTSLEPCAMCAGMMCLEHISKAVYAQHDPCYGGALQRLAKAGDGYPPYPVLAQPTASKLDFYSKINLAYKNFCSQNNCLVNGACGCNCNIIDFLISSTAQRLYADETQKFISYQPRFSSNNNIYGALYALYYFSTPWGGNCNNITSPIGSPLIVEPINDPNAMGIVKKAGSTHLIQGIKQVNKLGSLPKTKVQ